MYKHKPLEQPDHVRLILLLPGTFDQPLSCRLLHCQRTPSIPYTALSYVWGNSGFSNTLLVRGETADEDAVMPYMITCSLHKALQSLRPLYEPLFVWADQICINQLDNAEKSYQVAHMSSIYRNASNVTIWLGDYEGRPELDGLNKLAELKRLQSNNFVVSLLESELQDRTLSLRFFQRSWWTRTWTIQEFLLGRKTEYRIGRHIISEDVVRDACHITSDPRLPTLIDGFTSDPDSATRIKGSVFINDMLEILRPIRTLFECRDRSLRTKDVGLSKFVFDLSRDKLCGDNRDRVYAFIGIANNKVPVVPDYNLSENEVYTSFAVSCLLSGDLSVLDECTKPTSNLRRVGLRSYVPNLHLKVDQPEPLRSFQNLVRGGMQLPPLTFSSGKAFPVHTATCDLDGVIIRGVLLDTTAKTGVYARDTAEGLEQCLRWRKGLNAHANKQRVGGQKPLLACQHISPYSEEPFELVYFRTISANDQRCASHPNCQFLHHGENAPSDSDIEYVSKRYMRNHVLFMTNSGYLGFGPKHMKCRDRIVIFDGAETPYVLRPYGNNYLAVGPCFVRGWMYGDYFGHAVLDPFSGPLDDGSDVVDNSRETEKVDPSYAYVPPNHDGIKVLSKQDFCIY
jgi:hypothetical protein